MNPKYKFIDLNKGKNFLATESGVVCFFPNYYNKDWAEPQDYGCAENEWYFDTYVNLRLEEQCLLEDGLPHCYVNYANGTMVHCDYHYENATELWAVQPDNSTLEGDDSTSDAEIEGLTDE